MAWGPDKTVIVTGAAGFIASHLIDRLLAHGCSVIGVDDLSNGRVSNLQTASCRGSFEFVPVDVATEDGWAQVRATIAPGTAVAEVWHLAANSDIAAGVADESVDLHRTFLTTYETLRFMRRAGIPRIVFSSTSAVYGEIGRPLREDTGPFLPISNYGAMKLASEGAISAASAAFLERSWIFRFPNVVGSRATHGVCHDLIRRLRANPALLEVLGDGRQQKPYIHVDDLVDAMLFIKAQCEERVAVYNIAPDDEGARVSFIAETVVAAVAPGAEIRYRGGARGWQGDVPHFSYDTTKAKAMGWRPTASSHQAIIRAVGELVREIP